MNIDNLTYSELKQIAKMFNNASAEEKTLNTFIGMKVIVRTYTAGVWFGTIEEKSKDEVIISNARRLWKWHAKKGISLSGVANFGIQDAESRIEKAVASVWLQAIELIPCTSESIKSIEDAKDATT